MLELVVQKSSGYIALLKEILVKNPWQCLAIVLYSDEVTTGNIVQVNTAKKVALIITRRMKMIIMRLFDENEDKDEFDDDKGSGW